MSETFPPAKAVRARWQLLMLILMPIGVVLLATFVFYTGIGMPQGTHNKGTLLSLPLQLDEMAMQDALGKPYSWKDNPADSWTFLMAHTASCDEACRQKFWEVRQTRTALGKYASHVRRVWLVTEGMIDRDTQQWLQKEHKDMSVVYASQHDWLSLAGKAQDGVRAVGAARFFLVDPRGFVMMYYTPENTYKDVITDMKFLLKGVE